MMMRPLRIALPLLGMVALSPAAHADSYFDVEHARANARAGGPVSEYDAELLERYGALSGTPDWRARAPRSYRDKADMRSRHHHKKTRRPAHD